MSPFNMIQSLKRKQGPGTDDGRRKHQSLSTRGSSPASASALSSEDSIALVHLPSSSGSSSNLSYGAPASRPMSSLTMRPRTSIKSISSPTLRHCLNNIVPGQTERQTDFSEPSLSQATIANVEFSFPESNTSYAQTSHPDPLKHSCISDPIDQFKSRVQGNTVQHFKLNIVAPDLEIDSTATIPPGWPSRQSTMTYPTLLQTQYSSGSSDYGSTVSDGARIESAQPSSSIPDYHPSPCLICNTPQANGSILGFVYETSDDFVVHLWEVHMKASEWVERECLWAACNSHGKCKFATVKLWLAHVRNVHHKSYYCYREDCKYRFNGPNPKPFGSQAMLNRHGLSKSHARPVLCDKPGCTGKDNLKRKDKRNKHNLEYHGQFLCSTPSCPRSRHIDGIYYGFATAKDLESHEHEKHDRRSGGGDGRDMTMGYGMTVASSLFVD